MQPVPDLLREQWWGSVLAVTGAEGWSAQMAPPPQGTVFNLLRDTLALPLLLVTLPCSLDSCLRDCFPGCQRIISPGRQRHGQR